MAPYKINRNQKPLTDEQIERHKSFSALLKTQQELHQYKTLRKPLYKNFKVLSVIVVALTVILVLVLEQTDQKEQTNPPLNDSVPAKKDSNTTQPSSPSPETNPSDQSHPTPAYITPGGTVTPDHQITSTRSSLNVTNALDLNVASPHLPSALEIPFSSYTVNGEKGSVLYPGHGNKIIIPALAFKDAEGNVIKGEVTIQFRAFRNSFDFFRANIPMNWKNDQYLVSNGMFEIRGNYHGKPVQIVRSITVDMLAIKQKEDYQLYYFDENKKEWIEKGNDNKRETFRIEARMNTATTGGKGSVTPAGPATIPNPMFVFSNYTWELISPYEEQKFNSIIRTAWDNIQITEFEGDSFTLKFILNNQKDKENITLQATLYPIYTEPEKHRQWLATMYNHYKANEEKQLQALQKANDANKAYLNSPEYKRYQQWKTSREGKMAELNSSSYSRFTVNQFGIWNCDRPDALPKGATLAVNFVNEKNKPLSPKEAYLVDYQTNSLFKYYAANFNAFSFNPDHESIIWFVVDEKNIAMVGKEEMKSITQKSGTYTIKVKVVDISGMDEAAFNKLFSLPSHITSKQEITAQNQVNMPARVIVIKSPQDAANAEK